MMNSPKSCQKTPIKGRLNKSETFRGTPSKQKPVTNRNSDIDFNITPLLRNVRDPNIPKEGKSFRVTPIKQRSSNVRDVNIPLGLLNTGDNVCFFNSVVQVLYAIPAFRNFVQELAPDNQAITAIEDMFQEISNSNEPVRTSRYVQLLGLPNYIFGRQYDAHECLMKFLDKIYPRITDECMFKVTMLEWLVCDNCGKRIDQNVEGIDIGLNVKDAIGTQTVTGLLSHLQNATQLVDYKCDQCHRVNKCTKADLISHTSDMLILNLKLFKTVDNYGTIKKITPKLNIQDELHFYGNYYSIHAIIYHEGTQANSGHYTCGVKVNERWFMINDNLVKSIQQIKLSYSSTDYSIPYILIYKKRNDVIACIPSSVNDASEILNRPSALEQLPIISDETSNDDCSSTSAFKVDDVIPIVVR